MSSSDVEKLQGVPQAKRRLIYAAIKNQEPSERPKHWTWEGDEAFLIRQTAIAKKA